MWFDGYNTLTYNCLFNFIIGNRGCGKSYWFKKWAIKDFLKNENQFIYLRRYDTELDKIGTYFNDIIANNEFHETKFEVKGSEFFINEKLAGYSFPLSTASILKSNSYPLVTKIGFDEFIIDKGVHRYLTDEVNKFLDFYETIARTREIIVFFISNAITMTNPYCLYFNLQLPYNKNIVRKKDVLLQLVADEEFINMKNKTRFGQLIKGTSYAKYSIDNNFLRDNNTFVMRKTSKSKFYFTLKYLGNLYGVWVDYSEGKLFVSEDIDKYSKLVYSLTLADHTPNTLLIKKLSQSNMFKTFMDSYKLGNVYFESIKIKNIVYEIIKLSLY